MAGIRPSSATIACLYTHFIIFAIVAAFNFTIVDNALPISFGYGLSLIVFSVISILLGITAQDPDLAVLRSLLMSISALWTAVGLYHVIESLTPHSVTDSEALFAGYGTFILAFLFFIGGALHHKDRLTATLSLGMLLSCIFEMAALWRPVHRSAAAYYLLLAMVTLYFAVSKLLTRYRNGEPKGKVLKRKDFKPSKDYIPMGHLMNTLAAAVYAGQVTGIYQHSSSGGTWVFTAGLFQLLAAIVAVRRSEIYHGIYFIFHSTFWITNGFNLMVVFITQENSPTPLVAATVIHFIIFFIIAIISLTREMYQLPQNLALCVLCVAVLIDNNDSGSFLGAMGWIMFLSSLYGLAAHISRVKSSGFKLPLGTRLVDPEKLANKILSTFRCCASNIKTIGAGGKESNSLFSLDFTLGYSRYGGFDIAGFALNAIAAVAVLWTPQGFWVFPWAVVLGGLAQMMVGSVCFAKGLSFESCAFFTFGSLWLIWGPARGMGALALDNSPAIITGCVGFLAVGVLLLGLSTIVSKAWTVLTFFFNLVIVGILLHAINTNGSATYEIVINILFVIVCIYCFTATALRSVWGKELLPLGKPFIQVSYLHSQGELALWADATKASGVKTIADIMNRGGICGMPTDTVYVLTAACKFPAAVERAYNTKKLAEDRPMSMWISKVDQLAAGRPYYGELVWGLMNEIWPSTVSLVVPKGEWLQSLGLGESEKYIGRPDSIACRMPDNTVTSHLIDQTGPIAVSSANPTGEADTTHHLQVIAKLGVINCDGVLCSGPSPENMASTVVDCRSLANDGTLAFFRVGVVPRSQVEAIFAKVKAITEGTIPPSLGGGPHVNAGFELGEGGFDSFINANDNDDDDDNDDVDNNSGNKGTAARNSIAHYMGITGSINEDEAAIRRGKSMNRISSVVLRRKKRNTKLSGKFRKTVDSSANGVTGHFNKVYESIRPIHAAKTAETNTSINSMDSDHPYMAAFRASMRLPTSDLTVTSEKASVSGSDTYEPMVLMASRTGSEMEQDGKVIGGRPTDSQDSASLAFHVNPLFKPQDVTQL